MSVLLPCLISDGMVLRRNADVALWGGADEPVTVTFLGKQYGAAPDARGEWRVTLQNLAPGGPFTMRINDITLRDVYVGDVWLCAGQSNMQLWMRRVRHMYPEEMQTVQPMIRRFDAPLRRNFHGPQAALSGGCWAGVSPETIDDFSAAGYFFAKRLFARYGVPIGLIQTAVGGTPIHAWMPREALAGFPDLLESADRCADDAYVERAEADDAARAKAFYDGIDAADPGLSGRWFAPDHDDAAWESRPLLAPWPGAGSVWLRKTVDIPKKIAGKPATLFLGTVADWDTAYVNCETVGNTTYRYPPREYAVPALPEGRCVVALRVISNAGGRFTPGKQYLLATDAGSIDLSGDWKFRRGADAVPPRPGTVFQNMPTGLFNGMIAPLCRYAVTGAIWYQGESDTATPGRYAEKFAAMVGRWRGLWGYDFPFLFVELAQWGEGPAWNLLRREQRLCLSVPRTAMAAAYDLGEDNDLHPQNKQAVGDRLARCAMRVAYGETLPPSPFEVVGV